MATQGSLARSSVSIQQLNAAGAVTSTTIKYGVYATTGFWQLREPNPSGSFTPGVFRMNPVTMIKQLGGGPSSLVHWQNAYGGMRITGNHAGTFAFDAGIQPPAAAWQQNVADQVVLSAKAKVLSAEADVLLMLAEATETLRMLLRPMENVQKLLREYRTLSKRIGTGKSGSPRAKKWSAYADFASSEWLRFRYGITPLISDIESLIDAFYSKIAVASMLRYRSTVKTVGPSYTGPWLDWSEWVYVHGQVQRRYTQERKTTAIFVLQNNLELQRVLAQNRFGFSLHAIPAAVWELTGYSFVVDWVLSVGDWLRAIMPISNLTVLGSCVSQKTTTTYEVETRNLWLSASGGQFLSGEPSYYSFVEEKLERRVNPAVPVLPVLNLNRFGFKQAVDSLALLWQRVPYAWKSKRRR